ncbi:MAG: leucine-rich repeat domain-containing protein, partial [Clostridiales bacterium]|nr:leucine-rich repeat domain-containing protein [Clostridiales bacterium]
VGNGLYRVTVKAIGDGAEYLNSDESDAVKHIIATEGLEYKLNADATAYRLKSYGTATDTDVVIAPYYENLPVTEIGISAFGYNNQIVSVTIPDGVTLINISAFRDCTALTSITLPDGLTEIGTYAFYGCTALTSVTLPDGLTEINAYVFRDCTALRNVTLPDGLTEIGTYAFYGCTALTSITLPDGLTTIGYYVFENCTSLEEIVFLGTQEEWDAIEKGRDWNQNVHENFHITCLGEE